MEKEANGAETRQRIMKFIQDGQTLFGLLSGLIDENERLKLEAESMGHTCDRLRQENATLRNEQEELVGTFGKLMTDMLRPMNEMMQKIRGPQKPSPFGREPHSGSSNEATGPVLPVVARQQP